MNHFGAKEQFAICACGKFVNVWIIALTNTYIYGNLEFIKISHGHWRYLDNWTDRELFVLY